MIVAFDKEGGILIAERLVFLYSPCHLQLE